MPRYFFHVYDGSNFVDEVGTELSDVTEARKEAVIAAADALKSHAEAFWNHGEWYMNVMGETGEAVCLLRFSADYPARS